MAGPESNLTGRVASWGGAANTQLISTGGTPLAQFSFNMNAPSVEYLPFTGTGVGLAVAGLASWNATLNMLLAIPQIGNTSLITLADGYVLHCDAFNINIAAGVVDTTGSISTTPEFRTFIPGAFRWRGSWEGYLDDSTAMSDIGAAGTAGTATFAYGINSGGSALNLSGSIIPDAGGLALKDGTANRYTYSFIGNSPLVHAGRASGIIASAASVVLPLASALVLSAGASTKVSGTAFWTNINLQTRVDDLVSVTVNAQGTGDPNLSHSDTSDG